jgi:arginase
MPTFAILDAPSILGLRRSGVEYLPRALRDAGLLERLGAEDAGRVDTLNDRYSAERDKATGLLNGQAIRAFSSRLADSVACLFQSGRFPVVLGGDCSILLGALLALRRIGCYGLVFLDGHADFYQPEASPTGEVADMDLAIVSGRGPDIVANIEGLRPLVRDEDVVLLGCRDREEAERAGSRDVRDTAMILFDLDRVRELGATRAAETAVRALSRNELAGFWVHLDADVLDDAVMPAVDYRLPGGLSFEELSAMLRSLLGSGRAVGLTITILNPSLDPEGAIANQFVDALVAGLT